MKRHAGVASRQRCVPFPCFHCFSHLFFALFRIVLALAVFSAAVQSLAL